MTQQQTFTPYERHRTGTNLRREVSLQNRKRRKLTPVDDFVSSWSKRPLLCRLHIHRPVVWQDRLGYAETLPRLRPHCGRCAYRWRDDL